MPSHILAEIMHHLMIAEAIENGWVRKTNPVKQLTKTPEIVQKLVRYKEIMTDLLSIGLHIEPLLHMDFINALTFQKNFGLLTNDALLFAIAQRVNTKNIASADKIFLRLKSFNVYAPDDIGK